MTAVDDRPSGALVGALVGALAAASGRAHREDPVLPRTGGPAGNAALTAWTGLVLLVLSVAELLTLFDVRGLISWHVAIGALLVPPALLKTGVTTWRMVRYYRGDDAYTTAGPPPLLLRILGPLVVLSTMGLLGSGVLLVLLGPRTSRHVVVNLPLLSVNWVTLHQIAFIIWATAAGLHLIGRLVPAIQIVGRRLRVPGRASRIAVAATILAAAVPLAFLVVHLAADWRHDGPPHRPVGLSGPVHP